MDPSGTTNESLQAEEMEVMTSIFDKEWKIINLNSYNIDIRNSFKKSVFFEVFLPKDYPLNSPPRWEISAPWMRKDAKEELKLILKNVSDENKGECILYALISRIQEFIEDPSTEDNISNNQKYNSTVSENELDSLSIKEPKNQAFPEVFHGECIEDRKSIFQTHAAADQALPEIFHGECIEDRKSIFQAHAAKVTSEKQVKKILEKLKKCKKIAAATHNMFAYRILGNTKYPIQNSDDDGEGRGGNVILTLLQKCEATNVVVIVTRWYGGVHLGTDRFRHICDAAKSVLIEAGFITKTSVGKTTKKKSK
ncbi:protein IMPACT [Caerostris darwini]|uniref:Protein IMPACT n=1 Tax=Caerostris darwini TaxID=1538125 RepID=A0AAV4U685_9ARAC|nr:protein IMPACT [Caerostris darwini]